MKNILVPVGSHKNAVSTLQYVIDFMQGSEAKIYIIKVFGVSKAASSMKNIDQVLEQDADKELKELLKQIDSKGFKIIAKSVKGKIADSIQRVAKQLEIDLIVGSSKSTSPDKDVFLGKIAGSIIKDTDIPMLVIPRKYQFKKISKVLMAVKSGMISKPEILTPLKYILSKFDSQLNVLRVITPFSIETDANLAPEIEALKSTFKTTENATVFQGVLEHLHAYNPDMICVIRRKRGFFSKLWQDDKVYKKDFESRVPLLILKGKV